MTYSLVLCVRKARISIIKAANIPGPGSSPRLLKKSLLPVSGI